MTDISDEVVLCDQRVRDLASEMASELEAFRIGLDDLQASTAHKIANTQNRLLDQNRANLQRIESEGEDSTAERIRKLREGSSGRFVGGPNPWDDSELRRTAGSYGGIAKLVTIGTILGSADSSSVQDPIPATVEMLGNVMIDISTPYKDVATDLVRSIITRSLAAMPGGTLHLHILEPSGKGEGTGPLLPLGLEANLLGGGVVDRAERIKHKLDELSERIGTVNKSFLQGNGTLTDYNNRLQEVAEPYHMLVLFDAPAGMSGKLVDEVNAIASSGPKAGVFVVCVNDVSKSLDTSCSWDEFRQNATEISIGERNEISYYQLDPSGHSAGRATFEFEIACPPPADAIAAVVAAVGERAKENNGRTIPFDYVLPTEIWFDGGDASHSTSEKIVVPVGASGITQQTVEFGDSPVHALMVGQTGSGKSTLIHTLIHAAAARYPPDELELYLVDLKEGLEFGQYIPSAHNPGLPQVRVIAASADPEFALSVLEGLQSKAKERMEVDFPEASRKHSVHITGLGEYRDTTQLSMPRVLCVIDEFHMLFTGDDASLAERAWSAIEYIAKEARAAGVHLLLASQSLAGIGKGGRHTSILNQFAARIAMSCTAEDSKLIFGSKNKAAAGLSRQGDAIYNDERGSIEANIPFRVAYAGKQELLELRKKIDDGYRHLSGQGPAEPIVFNGDEFGELTDNESFQRALKGEREHDKVSFAWVGEAVTIGGFARIAFWPERQHHLTVVGRDGDARSGVLASAARSLVAQNSDVEVLLFNGESPMSDQHHVAQDLAADPGISLSDIDTFERSVVELAEAVEDGTAKPTYVVGFALETASLGKSGSRDVHNAFTTILEKGAQQGVHVLGSWSSAQSMDLMDAHRKAFGHRVFVAVDSEDLSKLTTSTVRAKKKANRALMISVANQNVPETFIPYRA